ncbi:MAG: DUF3343 domain-containing protein [Coriobacteriia bacterium]
MREKQRFVVFAFATTHDALHAEQVLEDAGFPVRVVPRPTPIGGSADCGIAVRVREADADAARTALADARVTPSATVAIEDY